jgi:hypothetical protein
MIRYPLAKRPRCILGAKLPLKTLRFVFFIASVEDVYHERHWSFPRLWTVLVWRRLDVLEASGQRMIMQVLDPKITLIHLILS